MDKTQNIMNSTFIKRALFNIKESGKSPEEIDVLEELEKALNEEQALMCKVLNMPKKQSDVFLDCMKTAIFCECQMKSLFERMQQA